MDPTTIQFYASHAEAVGERYLAAGSAAAKYLAQAFTPGCRVLDVGCGSGRDLHALVAAGYKASGVDASDKMLQVARTHFPDLAGRLRGDSLPELPTVPDASLDGLLCWAVLMHLTPNMFSVRVRGRSLEPMIPDGSCCLFRGGDALAGTREGRIVLVSLRDGLDPETGGRLTVKRYSSEKRYDGEGGFLHTRIVLHPDNPEFDPIVIEVAEEGALRVVGEFVGLIGPDAGGKMDRAEH